MVDHHRPGVLAGVKIDQPVVTADGLVGHVFTGHGELSKVTLIIDPAFKVAGRLVRSGAPGWCRERHQDMVMQMVVPNAT